MDLKVLKDRVAQFEQALEQSKAHYHTLLGRLAEANDLVKLAVAADPALAPVAAVTEAVEAGAEAIDKVIEPH
jgi:hypothetical protein